MNIEEKKKELLEILTNEAYDFNNFEYSTLENMYDNNLISYYVFEESFNALTVSFTIDIRTIDKDTFTKLVKDAVSLFKKTKPEPKYQGRIPKEGAYVTVISKHTEVKGRVTFVTDEGLYIRSINGVLCWFFWDNISFIQFNNSETVSITKEEIKYCMNDAQLLETLIENIANYIQIKEAKRVINSKYGTKEFKYTDTDVLNVKNLISLYPTIMMQGGRNVGKTALLKHYINNMDGSKQYIIYVAGTSYKLTEGDFVKLYIKNREYSEVGIFEGVSDEGIMVYDDGGRTSTTAIKSINAIGTFKKGGN